MNDRSRAPNHDGAQSLRPGVPPEGYLGYRGNEPPEGVQVGWTGWILIFLVTAALLFLGLWMILRRYPYMTFF